MNAGDFNLRKVLRFFVETGQRTQHKTLRLDLIEERMAVVKNGLEDFSIEHLKVIKDEEEEYWRFLRWWKLPEIEDEVFDDFTGELVDLEPNDSAVILNLFKALKNIEIVSCVLRFICPEHYGILSPPVENLLNVRGKDPVEKYMNYLDNLAELKEEYNFARIADVDMALWTLANILNYSDLRADPKFRQIYDQYILKSNPIKRIMARNSLEDIWQEKSYLSIGDLFLDTDYVVAGILARRELEKFVKKICKKYGIAEIDRDVGPRKFCDLVNDIGHKGLIGNEDRLLMRKLYGLGSQLVHGRENRVSKVQVKDMLVETSQLLENYSHL